MHTRTATWVAWSLWAVTLALVVGGLLLGVANRPDAPLYEYWLETTLINPTFATLGALIISRRPENVIGWIFSVSSIAGGIQMFSGQYATVALYSSDTRLPGGAVAAWLSTLMQTSVVAAALFLILLFPTGRLLSPRWRVVAWIAGLTITISLVSLAPHQGEFMGIPPTGKRVSIGLIDIVRIADEKVVEHWAIGDNLGMMQQLGVIGGLRQSNTSGPT